MLFMRLFIRSLFIIIKQQFLLQRSFFKIDSLKHGSVLCIYIYMKIDITKILNEQKLTITWTTCKSSALSFVDYNFSAFVLCLLNIYITDSDFFYT